MISMKRAGLKLFSLCVLALGLMAFSAAAAQAEGVWMYKGTNIETTAKNKAIVGNFEVVGGVRTDGTLLAVLGLNKVEFLCTNAQLLNAILEPEGAISESNKNAKIDFSGCRTLINGIEEKACEPKATGGLAGTIETEEGFSLLELHKLSETAKDAITVITPKVGTVFAVIHMSEGCPLGSAVKVFGTLALVDVGGNTGLLEEKQIHNATEFAPLTELKVGNGKSESKATLDGKIEIELATHEIWNGLDK